MNNEADNTIIIFNDENGNEERMEFLDIIEYQGEEFVALLPCEETDEPGEVVILMIEKTGDAEETCVSVDDEETLNAVFDVFRERNKDLFDFVD